MIHRFVVSVIYKNRASYFYYPSISCKTKDGEMKHLIERLKLENEPYELKITHLCEVTKK